MVITLVIREWADAAVIGAVVLLNAIVGFTQEHRAENAMQALMRMIAAKATVLRDGRQEDLDAQNLVPGDIVLLESGDVVPADLRFLKCTHLEIDEALLTGESLPVAKSPDPLVVERTIPLGDQRNMAFMGTAVTAGRGIGPLPAPADPAAVTNAAEYAGSYHRGDAVLALTAENGKLLLHYDGHQIALERRNEDAFYVAHPDFALFLLEFKREDGKVVEAFHGAQWYINQSYSVPRHFDCPVEWEAYTGHYRARNPELSNFRVVIRKDALFLILPWCLVEPLIPLAEDFFRIGQDRRSPETLRFHAVVDGRALRADFSGCPYYRTFTP